MRNITIIINLSFSTHLLFLRLFIPSSTSALPFVIIFLLPKEFCLSSTLNLLAISSLSSLSLEEKNHYFASISEGYFSLNTEKCFPSVALGVSLHCLSGFQRFFWKVGCQSYPCLFAQFYAAAVRIFSLSKESAVLIATVFSPGLHSTS